MSTIKRSHNARWANLTASQRIEYRREYRHMRWAANVSRILASGMIHRCVSVGSWDW